MHAREQVVAASLCAERAWTPTLNPTLQGADAGALDYALNRAIDAFYNDRAWFRGLQSRVMRWAAGGRCVCAQRLHACHPATPISSAARSLPPPNATPSTPQDGLELEPPRSRVH